jgi:uncharacterized protein YegL
MRNAYLRRLGLWLLVAIISIGMMGCSKKSLSRPDVVPPQAGKEKAAPEHPAPDGTGDATKVAGVEPEPTTPLVILDADEPGKNSPASKPDVARGAEHGEKLEALDAEVSSTASSEPVDSKASESGDVSKDELLRKRIGSLEKKKSLISLKAAETGGSREAPHSYSAASVKAASHDDNEEIVSYRDFCRDNAGLPIPYPWDVSERYVIRVQRKDSSAVFNAGVVIRDGKGRPVFQAKTQASGEIVLFPKMDLGTGYATIADYTISVDDAKPLRIQKSADNMIPMVVDDQNQSGSVSLQVCFLIDATGSMSDEIRQLQDVLFSIHSRLLALPLKPKIKFSVVAYRDAKDAFLVKGYPFMADIDSFQIALESISANGGGDYPEDIESGLAYCLDSLRWDDGSVKCIFLMGDAPPHLDMKEKNYLRQSRQCRENGMMICPIGASGLKIDGEFVFRQMAILTNGEFVFLHYGEQGESDGTESRADPGKVSHHTGSNYTARRLDDIVVGIITHELGYLTPKALLTYNDPAPQEQADLLETRVNNLMQQVLTDERKLSGKTLAIAPLQTSDSALGQLSEYLWELAIEKVPGYTKAAIVERKRIEEIFKEQALSLTGALAISDGHNIGHILNADYLLLSNLHYLGNVRVCHMRLVDCTNGTILSAARVKL